jgi:hypothetical protein
MTARTSAPLLWLALAATAAGCGDVTFPWSSPGPMLSVSSSNVDFAAVVGEPPPAPRTVTVKFRGEALDGGFVGAVPSWATAQASSEGAGIASITIGITTTTLEPGTYGATLRFVTAQADGSELTVRDVDIRYRVGLPLAASQAALELVAPSAGATAPPVELTLTAGLLPARWSLAVESADGRPTDWLSLAPASGTLSTPTGTVRVSAAPRPMGTYGAVLVLRDGAGAERGRIPVTYRVEGAYALTGAASAGVGEGASLADLERTLTLETRLDAATGAGCRWTIASDAPWLTVTPSSGDLAADTPLTLRLAAEQLWALPNGRHTAGLVVTITSGPATNSTAWFTLDLALQPALAAPATAPFVVRGSSTAQDLTRTVAVESNLGEAFAAHGGFSTTSSAGWIAATPQAGSVVLDLAPDALALLADGRYAATVTLVPDSPRVSGATFQATLDQAVPTITSVTPYTAWVNHASRLLVRGSGFGAAGTIPITVGGGDPVLGTVVSDTELRVTATAPATPGRVTVAVASAIVAARSAGSLLVLPEPGYVAYTAALAKPYLKMALDPERQAVLLTGGSAGDVRRLRFSQGAWSADAYALPRASGVAVTATGADVLATAGGVYDVPTVVRLDPETLAERQVSTFNDYYTTYDLIAPLADGRTMLVNSEQWTSTKWYPSLQTAPYLDAWGPTLLLTRDRGRMVIQAAYEDASFDVSDGSFRVRTLASAYERSQAISEDGGRLVVWTTVYDRDFKALGTLTTPTSGAWALAVSPDGAYAYTLGYETGAAKWVLRRADLRPGSGPYTAVATATAVPLPPSDIPQAMAVSEDGSTLFVLASSGAGGTFLAVPLP